MGNIIQQYLLLKQRLESVERFGSPYQFVKFLSVCVRDFDLVFKTSKSTKVEHNMIVFSSYYDPEEDKQLFPCIDVNVVFCPAQKEIYTAQLDTDHIVTDLYSAIYHEKVHRSQYRNRKFAHLKKVKRSNEDQTYLGCKDEIEAYGAEIALESYLRGVSNIELEIHRSKTYEWYVETFDKSHEVVVELVEQTCKYYNKLKGESHVL